MYPVTYLNGEYLPTKEATLHVSDLAITRGYGIFDYFRYKDHRPIFVADHLDRFYAGAEEMYLNIPVTKPELRDVIQQLIERNEHSAGGIRFVLTGGYAADGYTPASPNLIGTATPATSAPAALFENGCTVYLHDYERQLPQVKTIDYVEGIRVQRILAEVNADYALYTDREGNVRESDRSNFLVVRDGTLITPAASLLHGITRKHILKLAERLRLPTQITEVHADDLLSADEAIICSSTKGPMPITSVAGQLAPRKQEHKKINGGIVGPLTKKLITEWPAYVLKYG